MTATDVRAPELPRPDGTAARPPADGRVRVGLLFGQQVDDLEPLVRYGRRCADRGARLWLGQSLTVESHLALAALAGRGVSVDTGLGVAVAPLRTPWLAWSEASSVARLMQRSVTACYGIGSLAAAEALRGAPMPAPASWVRRFVAEVAELRDGPGPESPVPPVELGCGVLRSGMARQAAAVADAVVTWLTPVHHIAAALAPALEAGAAAAGRAAPRVVAIVPCAVRRPGRDPVRLAATAVGQHIRLPHYASMLTAAGADLRGDRAHDLRAVLATGVFAYGSPAEVAAAVLAHAAAGVDEVVLHVGGAALVEGHDAALADACDVLDALDALDARAAPTGARVPSPSRPRAHEGTTGR